MRCELLPQKLKITQFKSHMDANSSTHSMGSKMDMHMLLYSYPCSLGLALVRKIRGSNKHFAKNHCFRKIKMSSNSQCEVHRVHRAIVSREELEGEHSQLAR